MTNLHQAIGQLILGKVAATDLESESRELLRAGTMGGITLFRDNAEQLHQLVKLVDDVRSSCAVRPVVTVDQEGGAVQRLDRVITPLPSMMALGALPDQERAFEMAKISGEQMALIGINVVLAPVLDVNTNRANPIIGSRAFGSKARLVATRGEMLARGYASVGVLPVGKHFPGHGDTSVDSHLQLPCIDHSLTRMEEVELVPFRHVASFIPGMLTSHVRVPAMDSKPLPASLSYEMTTVWLRQKLGFNGLIFTDDMLMKAITDNWGLEEACILAVLAGADQLLVCTGADKVAAVHAAITRAVNDGRIPESRIQESVDRRNRIVGNVCDRFEFKGDNQARFIRLRDSIARGYELTEQLTTAAMSKSTSNSEDIAWPDEPVTLVIPAHPRYPLPFAEALAEMSPSIRVKQVRYALNPSDEEIATTVSNCRGEKVAFFTFRAPLNPNQLKLATQLQENCDAWLAVAIDTPYELDDLSGWQSSLSMYDPSDFAVRCFAKLASKAKTALL